MGINYIDGIRFKNAIVAGAQRVIQLQEHLNRINVFPVPDGDTGTNMALTLKSVAEGAINSQERNLSAVSNILAESALMGARGNSGAILAQFFQGLAESFEGRARASLHHFAEAVQRAARCAREAISEPKEGTILTVLQDWANHIQERYHQAGDFVELLSGSLETARQSLKQTPKKLKVLAKAGVVDAGAKGFVEMLEGIYHFLHTGKVESIELDGAMAKADAANVEAGTEDITFRYCTECYLRGDHIDREAIRAELMQHGNSLIVAGGAKNLRIHIHTNEPEKVFEILARYGEITSTKYDDMWAQHTEAHGEEKTADIALITDSTCDLPDEYLIKNRVRVVPLTLNIGSESYLDRVTITNREFYRRFSEEYQKFTTSQPAPREFQQTYLLAREMHENALVILLSSTLSGTYQAGVAAAKTVKNMNIEVVDSRMVSGGLGILVQLAAERIRAGESLSSIRAFIEEARHRVKLYISVETVEYLVRGGRVGKTKGFLARLLGLQPVLTYASDGKVKVAAKARGVEKSRRKVLDMVKREGRGKKNVRIIVIHAQARKAAQQFADELSRYFEISDIPVLEISPALGAHAGPGTVAVAFYGE